MTVTRLPYFTALAALATTILAAHVDQAAAQAPAAPEGAAAVGASTSALSGAVFPRRDSQHAMTEAQQIVAQLPPPMHGRLLPQPPLPADAPMPSSDPRDLQGTWVSNQPLEARAQKDMYGAEVPFNLAGAKTLSRHVMAQATGRPFSNASAECLPPGPQWQRDLNYPFQIVQGKTWVEFIFEEYHGRWNISLDTTASPLPPDKEYMGRSIGHWDGDTLVVETSDFRRALWLDIDGTPVSADGKLIQRIRKVNLGNGKPFLEIVTTIVDKAYYTDPWSIVRTFGWHPGLAVLKEYNCEEQVGDPSGISYNGLVPEPE